jgi:DNA-binding helix-hairpin-helix protein with protein kinase domain
LISTWGAVKAARQAEHERACREIDANNHRLIADWKVANAPWVAEEKRWHDRTLNAEAETLRLESELNRQRSVTESRFRQRKDGASGIVASHDRAKLDYEREVRQADADSKQIQLEEHLDKALIRQAKLKGITGDRILSLESFGIETAKDVTLLSSQKVPGIGKVLSKRLVDWRNSLSASFRPQQTLPDSEKNRIASRYAPVMRPLAESIQWAINDLDAIAMSHRTREAELLRTIATAVQTLAVAEAHVRAMKVG